MKIYHYDQFTGQFLGIDDADEQPLEKGAYLKPAFSTFDVPPTPGANQVPVYKNGVWELTDDYLGVQYWLPDGMSVVIDQLGVVPPTDAIYTKPDPSLSNVQSDKIQNLYLDCGGEITSGYQSQALGQNHLYPSKPTDQVNMTASVTDSLVAMQDARETVWAQNTVYSIGDVILIDGEYLIAVTEGKSSVKIPSVPPLDQTFTDGDIEWKVWTTEFWCADMQGVWEMRQHTVKQIQKAGKDGKYFILSQQNKLDGLVSQVNAATSLAEVDAISW